VTGAANTRRMPTPGPASRRPAVAGGVFRAGLLASADTAKAARSGCADPDGDCVELLNITQPNLVAEMHKRLLRTGADMLFTNTSGAAPQLLDRYRMHDEAFSVSYLGAEIASRVAREAPGNADRPRVIGDVRMPWHMPVHGFITGAEVEDAVASMTSAQIAGGVDGIRLQASRHSAHLVAAFNGARAGMAEAGRKVPIMVSVRHDTLGLAMDRGDDVSSLVSAASLAHSLGAAALSIESHASCDVTLDTLDNLAETAGRLLFIAPGAPEAVIRHCLANPVISRRLAFVGIETPAQAWRLSRFTPANAEPAWLRPEGCNDPGVGAPTARSPRIGAA
jgi:methionine synthase I (cobalamin-dependent)